MLLEKETVWQDEDLVLEPCLDEEGNPVERINLEEFWFNMYMTEEDRCDEIYG